MDYLADCTVLLPLVDEAHEHHKGARQWFSRLTPSDAMLLCRHSQLNLMRLMASENVMHGAALRMLDSWVLTTRLAAAPGTRFAPEPPGLDATWRGLCEAAGTHPKRVHDTYLAAFAICRRCRLVTYDTDFREYAGLDLQLLL